MSAWLCETCGYDGLKASFRGTVEFSVLVFCPNCGHELQRANDPLAAIERPDSPVHFDDFVEGNW